MLKSPLRQTSFGLLLLLALLLTGAGQVLPQGVVGHGGWELERILGRGSADHISISPDGNTLAVAGSRGVSLFSLPRLEDVGTLAAERWIASAHWSPDGKRLATVSHGGPAFRLKGLPQETGRHHLLLSQRNPRAVQVWDVAGRQLLHDLEFSAATDALAWSPTGDTLVGTGDTAGGREADGTLRIWDATTGKTRIRLVGSDGQSHAIMYSPDGKSIASVGQSLNLSVWDTGSGVLRYTTPTHVTGNFLSWSPDSDFLTLVDWYGVLHVLDANTGDVLERLHLSSYSHALAWSPTDSKIAIATDNALFQLFWNSGKLDPNYLLSHDGAAVRNLAWSPEGKYVAAADANSIVRFWSLSTDGFRPSPPYLTYDSRVLDLVWTPKCCTLVTRSENGVIQVRDVETGDTLGQVTGFAAPGGTGIQTGYVYLSWWPDSERLFLGRRNISGWGVQHLFPDGRSWNVSDGRRQPEERWLSESQPSPDGTRLATARGDLVTIQDIESGRQLLDLEHDARTWSVHWSGDGSRLAVIFAPGEEGDLPRIRVWDLGDSATPLAEFTISQSGGRALVWSPDGRYLANSAEIEHASGYSPAIRILDVDNNRLLIEFRASDFAYGLAWSPDWRRIAIAGSYSLSLWELNTDEFGFSERWSTRMRELDGSASDVAWSPDGQLLATASRTQTQDFSSTHPALVTIFDAGTGERLAHLQGHTGDVKRVVWSPDGKRLASTGQDATVRIWRRPDTGQ